MTRAELILKYLHSYETDSLEELVQNLLEQGYTKQEIILGIKDYIDGKE